MTELCQVSTYIPHYIGRFSLTWTLKKSTPAPLQSQKVTLQRLNKVEILGGHDPKKSQKRMIFTPGRGKSTENH